MADNYQQLVDAGVIPKGANLSDAEKTVIAGLSPEEVRTLVEIRGKLLAEERKTQGEAFKVDDSDMNANFVV